MTEQVKSFELTSGTYNVARASAIAQDEILSLLTAGLVQRLAVAEKADADEDMIMFMFMAMPFAQKQTIDRLLLTKVFKQGDTVPVMLDNMPVMDLNRLRAKALIWNLADFFTYWASAREKDALTQQ